MPATDTAPAEQHGGRLWRRPDGSGEPDPPFHRYCAVWPLDPWKGPDPPESVRLCPPLVRPVIRHTPFFVVFAGLVLLGEAQLRPDFRNLDLLLGLLGWLLTGGFGLVFVLVSLAIWFLVFFLLGTAGVVGRGTAGSVTRASIVYGLIALLGTGVLYTLYLATLSGNPARLETDIAVTSGLLLIALVGGMLIYDTILRLEHLLENLPDHYDQIVERASGSFSMQYQQRLEELKRALEAITPVPREILDIPSAYAAAALVVFHFVLIWLFTKGPFGLNLVSTWVVAILFDLVIVAVAFQFVVLFRFFHDLLADPASGAVGPRLTYLPNDPGTHGVFADLGRFATRINWLLLLAGAYLVYVVTRFLGGGVPGPAVPAADTTVQTLITGVKYFGPLTLYLVFVAGWFYLSFWQLHQRMKGDKQDWLANLRRDWPENLPDQLNKSQESAEAINESLEKLKQAAEEAEVPDVDEFLQSELGKAPVWPVKRTQLVGILVADAIPALVLVLQAFAPVLRLAT